MADVDIEDTGERLVPEFHVGQLTYAEHLIRYRAALGLVQGKRVLDIASGSGYGSALLGTSAAHVDGVDVSEDAVAYARDRFSRPNVEFHVGSGTSIPLDDDSVDVVITFETIEHIEDYARFVSEIRRVLRPDGIAVVSTPNDLEFVEGNHFHLHEFEREELKALLGREFTHLDEYFQATWKYVAIGSLDELQAESTGWSTTNMAPADPEKVLYFYFLCSNRPIDEKIKPLGALGEHYSDRDLIGGLRGMQSRIDDLEAHAAELAQIKGSKSFRLAQRFSALRHPIRSLRR